jgi:hypothetical protein
MGMEREERKRRREHKGHEKTNSYIGPDKDQENQVSFYLCIKTGNLRFCVF